MALIKCNNCGRSVSDRATVCPHCGCDPHVAKDANNETDNHSENEQNPNLTTCPSCGSLVSKKAKVCPKCGQSILTVSTQNQNATENSLNIDEYDCSEEHSANRGLLSIVGILTVIALVFAAFLFSGNRYYNGKTLKFTIDTCAVDTDSYVDDSLMTDSTSGYPIDYNSELADSAISFNDYNSNEQIEEEEIGFKSNTDVLDFVVGNSYSHDGITLRITDEAVYANDNKISTSKPVFRKISLNKGIITARPSISITVVRDDNRLVDNNNGDSYYY